MGVVMKKMTAFRAAPAFATVVAATSFAASAGANPLNLFSVPLHRAESATPSTAMAYAPAPRMDRMDAIEDGTQLSARLKRQIVDYRTGEPAGTVIIDTPNTQLYYVLGNG